MDTDTDGITEEEGEPSLQVMMAAVGDILATLTIRMEGLEKQKGIQYDPATSHTLYTPRQDGMEDDNVDIDSGYSNDNEF